MMRTLLALLFFIVLHPAQCRNRKDGNPQSRGVVVKNESGAKIDFFWIDPSTKQLAPSTTDGGVIAGSESSISSYIGHSFEVQELPKKKTNACVYEECRKAYFTVTSNEDQIYTVNADFTVTTEDHKTRARRRAQTALQKCRSQAAQADSSQGADSQLKSLSECLENSLAAAMNESEDEIVFQSELRKDLGQKWTNYACHDATNVTATIPVANSSWSYRDPRNSNRVMRYEVNTLFKSDFSEVRRVQSFVSESECQALTSSATDDGIVTAKSGTVADDIFKKLAFLISHATGLSIDDLNNFLLQMNVASDQSGTCKMESNGEMECKDDSVGSPEVIRISGDSTIVSVVLFCEAPKEGGQLYFTKTGTVFLTTQGRGSAMLILHQLDTVRERDPFVDEFAFCPVQQGQLVTFMNTL